MKYDIVVRAWVFCTMIATSFVVGKVLRIEDKVDALKPKETTVAIPVKASN